MEEEERGFEEAVGEEREELSVLGEHQLAGGGGGAALRSVLGEDGFHGFLEVIEFWGCVVQNYGIGTKAYLAKLDVNALFGLADEVVEYRPMPKFPAATRDLSLVCNEELPIIEIEKAIRASAGSHLEDVKLFDVYQGAQIEAGKKSVSYSMVLRSAESTLTDAEADAAVKRVLKALEKMDVVLRA